MLEVTAMDIMSKAGWNTFKRIDNENRFRLFLSLWGVLVPLYRVTLCGVRLRCCKEESLLVVHDQNFDCGDRIFILILKKSSKGKVDAPMHVDKL
jgi:hypothetical protein